LGIGLSGAPTLSQYSSGIFLRRNPSLGQNPLSRLGFFELAAIRLSGSENPLSRLGFSQTRSDTALWFRLIPCVIPALSIFAIDRAIQAPSALDRSLVLNQLDFEVSYLSQLLLDLCDLGVIIALQSSRIATGLAPLHLESVFTHFPSVLVTLPRPLANPNSLDLNFGPLNFGPCHSRGRSDKGHHGSR